MKKLIDTANASYQRKGSGSIKLGLIVVAICVIALAVAAIFAIPELIEMNPADVYNVTSDPISVTAIVPADGGKIGVDADLSQVYVTVRYSDGSEVEVALSEVIVSGLDVTEAATLDDVVLDFGGFKQTVTYEVLSTRKVLEYVASTGGKITGDAIQYVNAGSDAGTVVAVPDEGYKFVEWSDGNPNASRTDYKVSVDQVLVATFQKMEYTVVFFYPDGTTAREQVVLYNEAATKVPRLTEENMQLYGYTFIGWSESYDHITADTNIYPVYKKHATDVYIDYTTGNDGSALGTSDAMAYYTKGEQAIIRVTANPERIFTGWSIYTLQGGWQTIATQNDTQTYEIGSQFNYLTFETSRTGTSDEYVLMFTPSENTEELYLKANFVYKESKISFTSMSTKNVKGAIVLSQGEEIGSKFDVEDMESLGTIVGYTFLGWYIKNGDLKPDGTPVLIKNTQTFDQDAELIAYWQKDTYKVVFLMGDNDNSDLMANEFYGTLQVSENECVEGIILDVMYQDSLAGAARGKFPEEIPTKENYTFVGWYLMGEGNVATDKIIDRTYKVLNKITYVLPVFTVNTKVLTASIEGSGAITVAKGTSGEYKPIIGEYKMEAVSNYTIRIQAGESYVVEYVEIVSESGSTTEYPATTSYEFPLNAFILSDYHINVKFALDEFELRIINGTSGLKGTIQLQEIIDDAITTTSYTDLTVTGVTLSSGVTKHVWIMAEEGSYIESITIGDAMVTDLPEKANAYTIVLEKATSDVLIQVRYNFFQYVVSIDNDTAASSDKGEITQITAPESGTYGAGEVALFSIQTFKEEITGGGGQQAEGDKEIVYLGYYIKAIKINGFAIDPYNPDTRSYDVSGIVVNYGNRISNDDRDPRITSLQLALNGIGTDKKVTVEYAPLYYNVSVTTVGVGSTDISYTTVPYGGGAAVLANTSDGYYVYSSTINGALSVFENAPSQSRRVNLSNVACDYDVSFEFRQRYHNVNFNGVSASVSYTKSDGTIITESVPKSVSCEHATNNVFTISADEGYYIVEIKVNGIAQDIAFNATVHYLTVDSIDKNYNVQITTDVLTAGLKVVTNLPDTAEISYPDSVNYGSTVTVTIDVPNGYELNSYTLTPTPDPKFTPSLTTTKNPGQGITTYKLRVFNLIADTEVLFLFNPPSEDGDMANRNLHLQYDSAMGTLKEMNGVTKFLKDQSLVYSAEAKPGYALKYLIVDGVIVNVNNMGQYTDLITTEEGDKYVTAVFEKSAFKLSIFDNGYGLVTADKWQYKEGDNITIRVSAMTGYKVTAFSIGETGGQMTPCTQSVLDAFNSGTLDYTIDGTVTTSDLTIKVEFTALQYQMEVHVVGSGTVDKTLDSPLQIQYGEQVLIELNATENHFIDSILINGSSVDPATLSGNPRMNNDINKYISGTLAITAVGNLDITITYKPNVYSVSIADAAFGTVLVRSGDKPRSNGVGLELYTGDDLEIIMIAELGYHISNLVVNGIAIEDWQLDETQPNNNSNVSYVIPEISGNITIRVTFEINVYDIPTETINASINFQQYDLLPSSYGTVRVYNYSTMEDGTTYVGITHGSDIIFIVTPIRAKGYYVSKFTITWIDPSIKEGIQTKTDDFTQEAYERGRVSFHVAGVVQSVVVEFSKELFTFTEGTIVDQKNSTYRAEGIDHLGYTFVNPYEPNNSSVVVSLVDGMYEYGLTYIITSNPGEGYSRISFKVNDIERNASVRNNKYTGTITTNTKVFATYQINTHKVDLSSNAYNITKDFWKGEFDIYFETIYGDVLLWNPTHYNEQKNIIGTSGCVNVFKNYMEVTYNTEVRIVMRPFNAIYNTPYDDSSIDVNGYMISSFVLGSATQTLKDPDQEVNKTFKIKENTSIVGDFALHTYNVTVEMNTRNSGSRVTIKPETVTWGENTTITLTIGVGYDLIAVYINNTVDYVALESLCGFDGNGGSYYIGNITRDTVITLTLVCTPLDIIYTGGYNQAFDVDGTPFYSNSGVVFNKGTDAEDGYFSYAYGSYRIIPANGKITGDTGARYNDALTFYFIPVDGYKLSAVNIAMNDLNGNKYFAVTDLDSVKYDESKGYYYYTMPIGMMGVITVSAQYTIKTYSVTIATSGDGMVYSSYANTVSHHDSLDFTLRAGYGYHLKEVTINGNTIPWDYTREYANGYYIYQYTLNAVKVNNSLINGRSKFEMSIVFEVNSYDVVILVNGVDAQSMHKDETLTPDLPNNSIQYGKNATGVITQTRKEGYSITNIELTTQRKDVVLNYNTTGTTDNRKQERFSFVIGGAVMDMLDYHDAAKDVLYVYYETEIDKHTSVINTYLYENNVSPSTIPTEAGSPMFTLTAAYSDNLTGNTTVHEYGKTATFTFSLKDTDDYVFAGYQEYNSVTKKWKYVKNGENGIKLVGVGDKMEYTIKADREFRAVVFRVYDIQVEVHPEYKYLSGSINSSTFNMVYRTYIKMSATAIFDEEKMPNIDTTSMPLEDNDSTANDGVFSYRVYAFSRLKLNGTDTLTGSGMNVSKSVTYYYVSSTNMGGEATLVQTPVSFAAEDGEEVTGDKLVYAYYDNTTYLSFQFETIGGSTGNEGGNVAYYFVDSTGKTTATSPSAGNLKVNANSHMRVVITPKDNYEFSAIQQYAVDESASPDQNGNKVFKGEWEDLVADNEGFIKLTKVTNGAGRITQVTVDIIVTENMIFKIKFWKLINVTSSVSLITDETDDATIINKLTPNFIEASPDGVYKYQDTISYEVPTTYYSDTYNIRYQFVGFVVNGVNAYKQMGSSYPSSNAITFTLYEYDVNTSADGLYLVYDGTKFVADIVATYIPIYNIIIENEYLYEYYDNYTYSTYFDIGQISYKTTTYNNEYPLYYQTGSYVTSKLGSSDKDKTDSTIQVMGKLNSTSSSEVDLNNPNTGYNTWGDNSITLTWVSGSITQYSERYNFIAWQYYAYIGGTWQWVNIPDTYSKTADNKNTAKTFTFPLKALFANSYMTYADSELSAGMKQNSSQYDSNGDYKENKRIYAIRIRPLLERVVNVQIERQVYYTAYGIVDTAHANANPALILENRSTKGTFGYYDVITMTPSIQTGYKFLGWFLSANDDSYKITNTYNNGYGLNNASNTYAVDGNTLYVRLSENNVDKNTNYLTIYARYIKEWTITVMTKNESGTSNTILNSVPYIRQVYKDGAGNTTSQVDRSQKYTVTVEAGSVLYFKLYKNNSSSFNTEFDKYLRTETLSGSKTIWGQGNTSDDFINSSLPISDSNNPSTASYENSLYNALYCIHADANKTITMFFTTYGELTINNLYYGSTLEIPQSLANAIGCTSRRIADGGEFDNDNTSNGSIKITHIPIQANVEYDGKFGNILPNTRNALSLGGDSTGIVFQGSRISKKQQSFNYYNTSTGSQDSYTKRNVPFQNGLRSDAGLGTSSRPYRISTQQELTFIETLYNGNGYDCTYGSGTKLYFSMVNSISLSGYSVPMCATGNGFNGSFNGNGYTISGFNLQSGNYIGIFAKIYGGEMRNVIFAKGTTIGSGSSTYVGYAVGYAVNATISSVSLANNTTANTINGTDAGAIAGYVGGSSSVSGCNVYSAYVRNGNNVGALIGELAGSASVSSCNVYNSSVQAYSQCGGGIIGRISSSSARLVSCYASSGGVTIGSTGTKYNGGAVGYNAGTMQNITVSIGSTTIASTRPSSAFSSNNASDFESYGAGGITGYNAGYMDNCDLSGSGTLYFSGSMTGAICGVNAKNATINGSNTASYKVFISRDMNFGGCFGMIAGYSNGTVNNSGVSYYGGYSWSYGDAVFFIGNGNYDSTYTGGNTEGLAADTAVIYLGGIVGYNGSAGSMSYNSFCGKLYINRRCGNGGSNKTYMGGLMGWNNNKTNGNAFISNSVYSSNFFMFVNIWADNSSSAAAVYQYISDIAGNGAYPGSYGSVYSNNILLDRVANGSSYTGHKQTTTKILIVSYTKWTQSASGYRTGKAIAEIWVSRSGSCGTSGSDYITAKIPDQFYDSSSDNCYEYSGKLRQLFNSSRSVGYIK